MSEIQNQTELLRKVRLALQNNQYQDALKFLKQTADLAHESGDLGAEGRHLGNLALIYYRLNQPDRALEYFDQALDRARQEEDRVTEGGLLGNMGNILRELNRHADAVQYLNQALVIAQEIGDNRGRGIWLGNLGLVYDDLNQPERSVDLHSKSVEIARELRDMRGLASRLANLGNACVALKDYVAAVTHFKESVEIYRSLGETTELALRLGIIGNLYAELGRSTSDPGQAAEYFAGALDHYLQTLTLARELEDVITEAQLLRSIGNVLIHVGRFETALEHLLTAYQMFEVLGLEEQRDETTRSIRLARAYHAHLKKSPGS